MGQELPLVAGAACRFRCMHRFGVPRHVANHKPHPAVSMYFFRISGKIVLKLATVRTLVIGEFDDDEGSILRPQRATAVKP